jgi:hypothetical protein
MNLKVRNKTKKYRKLNNITRIKRKNTKNTKWGGVGEEDIERRDGESAADYTKRLKTIIKNVIEENKQIRTATRKSPSSTTRKSPSSATRKSPSSATRKSAKKTMKLEEDKYEGEVNEKGEKNGEGTMFYKPVIDKKDKNKKIYNEYVGQWKNNKREGEGIMMYNNGEDVYQGEWKNDKKDGNGKMTYANGDVHEGIWIEDVYIGKWDSYNFIGSGQYGKMTYANGDVFEGDLYKYNKYEKNGGGILTHHDGRKTLGNWKNDTLVNYLEINLGRTIYRVKEPEEIKKDNKYIIMHNIGEDVFLYFGNININTEKKQSIVANPDFIMDIIRVKDMSLEFDWEYQHYRKLLSSHYMRKIDKNLYKYNLYTTGDITENPFELKQNNVMIFAFEENMQREINKIRDISTFGKKQFSLFYLSYLKLSEEEKNSLKEHTNILDNINPFA